MFLAAFTSLSRTRARLNLVKNRTMVKNRIHGLLDKHGLHMPEATPRARRKILSAIL
jgi:transposase